MSLSSLNSRARSLREKKKARERANINWELYTKDNFIRECAMVLDISLLMTAFSIEVPGKIILLRAKVS
jgi:hypothetical protein